MGRIHRLLLLVGLAGAVALGLLSAGGNRSPAQDRPQEADRPAADQWTDLFDGKTLDGWKAIAFGGEGRVHVEDGAIVMERGSLLTGIVRVGDAPRDNYELAIEASRFEGDDFFSTTTFPVGRESCSLVVGGWGGQLVGLSSIDRADASENATSSTMEFENRCWYRVRIRVTPAAIRAWIDDRKVVDQPRKDHQFSVRMEVEPCRPLGIATWDTTGAVRAIRLRRLDERPSR